MEPKEFKFATDTSSLCVFDLATMRHRLEDDGDWWTWPADVTVDEVNSGNAAIVDLGADGAYSGQVMFVPLSAPDIEVRLSCPTKRLFIGAGEELTGNGLEPKGLRGGVFLKVETETILLQIRRAGTSHLVLAVLSDGEHPTNNFTEPLRLL